MDLGLSQTTVKRAREKHAAEFFPGDVTTSKFLDSVSEVVERFHTRGHWVGAKSTFTLAIPDDGLVFLPFFLDSIIRARIDRDPTLVQGAAYEFLFDGPGELDPEAGCGGAVIDRGLSPIDSVYPDTAGTLRFTATAGDVGKKIRVIGYDINGRVEIDGVAGEEVILVDGDVNTTTSFTAIQGIQKEITQAKVILSHVDTSVTELVVLESFMELPLFRSYAVIAQGSDNLIAYCKRRPIAVSAEEDYIFPGNLSALKLGLFAKNYEEKNDLERSEEYWKRAEEILNSESVEYRGGAIEKLEFSPWGTDISKIRRLK